MKVGDSEDSTRSPQIRPAHKIGNPVRERSLPCRPTSPDPSYLQLPSRAVQVRKHIQKPEVCAGARSSPDSPPPGCIGG
jgi:hypothetical protein